jgi:N-ethylmaleimide reductase
MLVLPILEVIAMNPERLTQPVKIGAIDAANRVFMAPLTRCRATKGTDAPNALIAEHYAQRSSAGLIVSEATQVLATGKGYMGTPGIYSSEQEEGWKLVTTAVHKAGGKIVAQLWHVGAISHPDLQPGNSLPVTASSGFNPGGTLYTPNGKVERVAARGLTLAEVREMVAAFKHSAQVALRAGFDGVEIHSANGYLLEQFIRDSSNSRQDAYGGSVENRLRFTLEIVDAAIEVWGAQRVGIRLSPVSGANNAKPDSNIQGTYGTLVEALSERKIAFVHFIEGNTGGERNLTGFDFSAARKTLAKNQVAYIANNKYTREMAIEALETNAADAVAFGVPFIANPDLPKRLATNSAMNAPIPASFYSSGATGYTDYPFL